MAGALFHYKQGPASYLVSGLVLGGQLVVPTGNTATTVTVAGAAAVNCLGVAGADANNTNPEGTPSLPGGWPGDGSNTGQDQLLETSALNIAVPVYNNVDINVTYAAAANFGQLLKAAASGQVTPWVDGTDTDPGTIVGRCTNPGGVASGAVGRAFIRV